MFTVLIIGSLERAFRGIPVINQSVFSYLIMVLYAANVVNFAVRKDVGNACYWLCALGITATVTFLMKSTH